MKTCDITQKGFEFAANKHSKGDTIRVFMYLCYEMDSSGYVDMTQSRIAENMEIAREQVARALSELVFLGIISKQRHDTKGRILIKVSNEYANKDFVWLVKDDEVDWNCKNSGEILYGN